MSTTSPAPRFPVWPIVASIVWGLALIPGSFAVIMSPMMFDAGVTPKVVIAFSGVLSFAALCLISIVGSWISWSATRHKQTGFVRSLPLVFALLPLLSVIAVLAGGL